MGVFEEPIKESQEGGRVFMELGGTLGVGNGA